MNLTRWAGAICLFVLAPAQAGDLEDGIKFHQLRAYPKAIAAFQRASDSGVAEAQRRMAFMYYRGEGVKQDNARAVVLFEKAATGGDAESARNLGTMYEYGLSVGQDNARAARWYRAAAELGEPNAQFSTSVMYYKGQGVGTDRAEAVKWWTIAMRHGPEWDERFRPSVESAEKKVPAEQVAEGQRRAVEWLSAHEARK